MLVLDAIAEILKREGITKLFCYPTTPLIEAAVRAGLTPILCRQERVGVDMADGYTRIMNGKPPGVFAMQYGPGIENAYAGIATAYSDAVPILLLPLAHARDVSQVPPMFRPSRTMAPVTKSVEEIVLPGEVTNIMRWAFSYLKHGHSGPVMVETPMDLCGHELGDEFVLDYKPVGRARSVPAASDIDDIARRLIEAERPVIQAGQGVLYAEASAELVELAELLDAPVMTTVDGKSAFPEDHALSFGTAGAVLTGQCQALLPSRDLVFGIGTSFTRHGLVTRILPRDQRIIHATHNPDDLYKGYDLEAALLGDAKLTLQQLVEAVRDRLGASPQRDSGIREEIRRAREPWLAQWQAKLNSSESPITPYRVISEFTRLVDPAEAIVTHDSGSPRDQMLPFYTATTPRCYLGWGKSHALGTGLGLTIGAKHAAPDKFCVHFMGDAAFGMVGLDFESAVRTDAPILAIVLNNSTMAIEIPSMKLSHERFKARDIGGNYAGIARDLGGWSERVTDPNEVGPAILRARRATENGQAALLEVITSAETEFSFRKGLFH
jgi:acetolactate synthase-1/2/3 large subunit